MRGAFEFEWQSGVAVFTPNGRVPSQKMSMSAGVAASFAMAGLGTDTGNSIRGPSGWTSNVGIRASLGLSSRQALHLYLLGLQFLV